MDVVDAILLALGAYAAVGAVFAAGFAWRGAERLEPSAHGATLGFRVIIGPAAALLWPCLLVRWARAPRGAAERHA